MKTVIKKIEDFKEIKIGYTLVMWCEASQIYFNEIIDVHQHIETIKTRNELDGETEIDDVFNSLNAVDIIFPCSVDKVKLNYPEYFI
jgi:hypothetical protein